MPTVKQLRPFARAPLASFLEASGAVVLIQQPPEPVFQQVALRLAQARTVGMAHRSRLVERLLVMLQGFDALNVHFLRPDHDGQELTVGRLEDCKLVVHDPSVSKQHAVLRWHAAAHTCSVRDSGSMNGTWLNTRSLNEGEEWMLNDGDALGFGDAQFLFLRAETLHAHLQAG
ncbi:FHA domain-containing protein [Corallococcus sp. H22C18031201]|uniref:FHA domain-containing protein n=1 Tax=Citreicoccus inhibens TaxID=2849499 RepID=UPI000E72896F|nr:FHA domain-containing protein [Citreicoccus inhibens]MBU8895469.1 FHA domain-containing protein [Citreicoccus inhibens]RJS22499.1 FHA domain-containing protein [Corallococcus sp. H22C18031201]